MMSNPRVNNVSCLPITALCAAEVHPINLFFAGVGNTLRIYGSRSSSYLAHKIFEVQAIHGIRQHHTDSTEHGVSIDLVIWGGLHIALVTVSVKRGCEIALVNHKNSFTADDWILDVQSLKDSTNSLVVLTAHNNLYSVQYCIESNSWLLPLRICQGPATFLYSGQLLVLSPQRILIASGTVFGEVLAWTSVKQLSQDLSWTGIPKYVFYGHAGSVFGVRISDVILVNGEEHRILASCSDDRTIRIWDISKFDDRDLGLKLPQTKDTGFGREATSHLAMTWGHLSRIWNVDFLSHESNAMDFISHGEDGSCQLWSIDLAKLFTGAPQNFASVYSDRYHSGKNIWSHCFQKELRSWYTGGADGQIISRRFPSGHGETSPIPFKSLQFSRTGSEDPATCKALRTYTVLSNGNVFATTDNGLLVEGVPTNSTIKWSLIASSLGNSFLLATKPAGKIVVYADNQHKSLHLYNSESGAKVKFPLEFESQIQYIQTAWSQNLTEDIRFCLIVSLNGHKDLIIIWASLQDEISIEKGYVDLPETFSITSCTFDPNSSLLILGSRAGAVAVYKDVTGPKRFMPATCLRHVHGSDTVTSVSVLHLLTSASYLLTTGRDGYYTILEHKAELEIVHRATSPLGSFIEGAILYPNGIRPSLLVYGFKSKDFILWDETNQIQLLAVDCGGAHRSWGFNLSDKSSSMFVWTKAGAFNVKQQEFSNHIVQHGGHGREIKALAVHSLNEQEYLIASGAEDTDIHLFKYRTNSTLAEDTEIDLFKNRTNSILPAEDTGILLFKNRTNLTRLAVLKAHTAGLQALRFSSCGTLLFSAAGAEEFLVWQISNIPVLNIGVKLAASLPSDGEISDARIMDFDLVKVEDESYDLVAALSNGKVKYITMKKSVTSHRDLEIDFGAICLTQANIIQNVLAIGATNGYLSFYARKGPEFMGSHRVHQSSITSLQCMVLGPHATLALSGGDDNALGITLIHKSVFRTLLIPKAHAAALTALTIIRHQKRLDINHVWLATAGNDQVVRLWSLLINTELHLSISMENVKIDLINEYWTSVADVSSMELLGSTSTCDPAHTNVEVLVAGVGMQVVTLPLNEAESS